MTCTGDDPAGTLDRGGIGRKSAIQSAIGEIVRRATLRAVAIWTPFAVAYLTTSALANPVTL